MCPIYIMEQFNSSASWNFAMITDAGAVDVLDFFCFCFLWWLTVSQYSGGHFWGDEVLSRCFHEVIFDRMQCSKPSLIKIGYLMHGLVQLMDLLLRSLSNTRLYFNHTNIAALVCANRLTYFWSIHKSYEPCKITMHRYITHVGVWTINTKALYILFLNFVITLHF